jgi:hypothetical protein
MMWQQSVTNGGKAVTARPLSPAAAAAAKVMSRSWSLPTQYDIGLDAAHPSVLLLPVADGSTLGVNAGSTAPAPRG